MKIYRNCCGLDAHKQTIAACLIREDESARLRSSWDEVRYPALLANFFYWCCERSGLHLRYLANISRAPSASVPTYAQAKVESPSALECPREHPLTRCIIFCPSTLIPSRGAVRWTGKHRDRRL
jgi:hypothetical protein